jgi:hypothetical protein
MQTMLINVLQFHPSYPVIAIIFQFEALREIYSEKTNRSRSISGIGRMNQGETKPK